MFVKKKLLFYTKVVLFFPKTNVVSLLNVKMKHLHTYLLKCHCIFLNINIIHSLICDRRTRFIHYIFHRVTIFM